MDFLFDKVYILENDKVMLRPLHAEDKESLIHFGIHEPEIWQYNINGGNGRENFEKYFDNALQLRNEEKMYPFVVIDKNTGNKVGMTRYYEISNEFKRLEIGYTWYGQQYQGTGLNKNCKYLLLEFAFEKLGMIRVGFGANSKNGRSINAMKSIGCTIEGIQRSFGRDAEGNVIDRVMLSILKTEWLANVKEDLRIKI